MSVYGRKRVAFVRDFLAGRESDGQTDVGHNVIAIITWKVTSSFSHPPVLEDPRGTILPLPFFFRFLFLWLLFKNERSNSSRQVQSLQ